MKKIIFLLISCFFIYSSSPAVFAAENITVDSSYLNFDNLSAYDIDDSAFLPETYSFINTYVNSENTKIYIFPILLYVDSYSNYYKSYILVQSHKYLNIEFTSNSVSSKYPEYVSVNITSDSNFEFSTNILTVRSLGGWTLDSRGSAKIIYIPSFGIYNMTNSIYDSSNYLLFDSGKCVSEKFCSVDYYFDSDENTDYSSGTDYTGILGTIKKTLDSIKNAIDNLIGIPPDGYFSEKINTIKNSVNEKYNLDSLFNFIGDLKNVNSAEPNLQFDKNLKVNDSSIPFNFRIDFSWFSGDIKNALFLLLRAAGYPLLIIYNLNQFYLLFRGRKFFDNGGEDDD